MYLFIPDTISHTISTNEHNSKCTKEISSLNDFSCMSGYLAPFHVRIFMQTSNIVLFEIDALSFFSLDEEYSQHQKTCYNSKSKHAKLH